MDEHLKLKIICDKIWYEIKFSNMYWKNWILYTDIWISEIYKDVREIIFTQEFMDKFEKKYWLIEAWTLIRSNLNNPTEYLYNLIK